MHILVCLEYHFVKTKRGEIWTPTTFDYPFWKRYLEVFDSVHVLARVAEVDKIGDGWKRANGEKVFFQTLPDYRGPWQYVMSAPKVSAGVKRSVRAHDAVMLRVPGQVSVCVESVLRRRGQPFGVEVVGDPENVFAPGVSPSRFRPFYRWWFGKALKRQCSKAAVAGYVTERALQAKYPPNARGYSTHYSDVFLTDSAYVDQPRAYEQLKHPHIVSIGSLSQMYKAPDIVIEALKICKQQGMDFTFDWIGGGKYQTSLERLTKSSGIGNRVRYLGDIPSGEPVRRNLDKADLFLLVSHTEGLPKAMIEAMARGLPCIGSSVGGIPELLSEESLVRPGDASALAQKIMAFLGDLPRLRRESVRNLEKSKQYHESILREKRVVVYEKLRDAQANWLRSVANR